MTQHAYSIEDQSDVDYLQDVMDDMIESVRSDHAAYDAEYNEIMGNHGYMDDTPSITPWWENR